MLNQILANLKSRKPHVVAKMAEVHQVIGQATVDRQLAVCDLSIDVMQLTAHQMELIRSRANTMAKEPEKGRVVYQIAEDLMHRGLDELKEIAQLHAVNKHEYQANSIGPFVREAARIMQRMADATKVGMLTEVVREAAEDLDYLRMCLALIGCSESVKKLIAHAVDPIRREGRDPGKLVAVAALVGDLLDSPEVSVELVTSMKKRLAEYLAD